MKTDETTIEIPVTIYMYTIVNTDKETLYLFAG